MTSDRRRRSNARQAYGKGHRSPHSANTQSCKALAPPVAGAALRHRWCNGIGASGEAPLVLSWHVVEVVRECRRAGRPSSHRQGPGRVGAHHSAHRDGAKRRGAPSRRPWPARAHRFPKRFRQSLSRSASAAVVSRGAARAGECSRGAKGSATRRHRSVGRFQCFGKRECVGRRADGARVVRRSSAVVSVGWTRVAGRSVSSRLASGELWIPRLGPGRSGALE